MAKLPAGLTRLRANLGVGMSYKEALAKAQPSAGRRPREGSAEEEANESPRERESEKDEN